MYFDVSSINIQLFNMNLSSIIAFLQHGGIIAYPTEAVYGLGCDPFNESAVKKLCEGESEKN